MPIVLLLLACNGPDPDVEVVPTGETGTPPQPCTEGTTCGDDGICWVTLCGGTFEMGSELGEDDEKPVHTVRVPHFELMQTEVTIAQYNLCVADGVCDDPEAWDPPPPAFCRDNDPDAPRGCLDWDMATDFCTWAGGRLASEAEWEYAARSRGQDERFPWGDDEPTCELAVLGYTEADTCGENGPAVACSRPDGSTEQGLCDMAGNIYEWVADWHHATYDGAPADGSAWEDPPGVFRVLRGGGINSNEEVTTTNRTFHEPEFRYSGSGTRCARDYLAR